MEWKPTVANGGAAVLHTSPVENTRGLAGREARPCFRSAVAVTEALFSQGAPAVERPSYRSVAALETRMLDRLNSLRERGRWRSWSAGENVLYHPRRLTATAALGTWLASRAHRANLIVTADFGFTS